MSKYKSIFNRKPDLSSIRSFCERINGLIQYIGIHNIFSEIEVIFINSFGKGYKNIYDFLNSHYKLKTLNIFYNYDNVTDNYPEDLVLANIEIYANCLKILYERNSYLKINVTRIYEAFSNFLTYKGYQLVFNKNQYHILDLDLPIETDDLLDNEVKSDFYTFYNYITKGDLHEKHKVLMALAHKLESKKEAVENLFGKQISKAIGYYGNQFHIRHPNFKNIDGLTGAELEEWYNYIYSFFINCFVNLDKLKIIKTS